MKVVSEESGEHYTWGEGCNAWYLVKEPSINIIKERIPQGFSETKHMHNYALQFFYILSGHAYFDVNGSPLSVKRNEGIHIPAGVPHLLKNEGEEDLVFIVISTPPSHGDRVEL